VLGHVDGTGGAAARDSGIRRPHEERRENTMLSKAMQDAINEQINKEYHSAYIYLSMAAYCESVNLPGAAHWMKVQAKEETGHGDKFFDYLVDQGARVILKPIAQVPTEFKSLLEVFEKALEHEKKMTGWLNQLYAQAVKESDYATQILLQWYITEQVEEEKNAGQIVEQLKIVGEHSSAIFMLDHHLASRK
jgi:ferritin